MSLNIEVISLAKALGYSAIGLNTILDQPDIDVVNRLDLSPKNPNMLLKNLRSYRWKTEIIIVNCRNKSVARQAGKDHRVDLITFSIDENWKNNHLDRQQAGLMKESGCGYLIDISQLLTNDPKRLRKRIECVMRDLENALRRDLPIVASSCAQDKWGLRDPYSLAALLRLLHIDEDSALNMISHVPYGMVKVNRAKLKKSYLASGVWIVED